MLIVQEQYPVGDVRYGTILDRSGNQGFSLQPQLVDQPEIARRPSARGNGRLSLRPAPDVHGILTVGDCAMPAAAKLDCGSGGPRRFRHAVLRAGRARGGANA